MKVLGKSFLKLAAIVGLMASFGLTSCQNGLGDKPELEYGSLTVFANSSDSRAFFTDEIKSAIVTVSGFDANGTKFEKKSGAVAVNGGTANGITVESIPVCKNASVTVKAYSDESAKTSISGVTISARKDIGIGENQITVNKASSAEGNVYAQLISMNYNTNNADTDAISAAIPAGVSFSLIDTESIAVDYKANSLKTSDAYKFEPASITVNAKDVNGIKFFISDPLSESWTVNGSSKILSVAPGTWKIYAVDGESITSETITVGQENIGTVTVNRKSDVKDKIIVHLSSSDGYKYVWAWKGSTNYTSSGSWPGDTLKDSDNDGYFDYTINATSTSIIFSNDSSQTDDLSIAAAGEYLFSNGSFTEWTGSSSDGSVTISVGTIEGPVKPSYSLPVSAYLGEQFTISVTSNVALTASTVTIGGQTKTLSIGDNTFDVSDFTTTAKTLTVSGTLSNSAGSTAVTGSIEVKEKPVNQILSDWNQITMFQVMVSSFQDGDSSRGYTDSYGPSGRIHNGDLQGIINALDYIKGLGCNALWMTPIFNSAGKNGEAMDSTGYYTYDYFNIDPKFGTNETFKTLVKECHDRGIAVILDGVVGHWSSGGCAASPSGKTPSRSNGMYKGCDYPASLSFFQEVLSYWITEYKIDGWRLDQAYQAGAKTGDVFTGGTNYWPQLRAAVESAAASNGTKGQNWGTLGYMCGEVLDGNQSNIQNWVVVNDGLQSCFDFPSRYKLCNAIVGGSDWANSAGSDTFVSAMTYTNNTYSNKGYTHSKGYYPNLFLANHDLYRFGDLIINWKKYPYGSDQYVGKCKVALSAMAAYTGPITIYYGDEWGEATQDIGLIQSLSEQVGKGAYWDNSSRTAGHIDKAQNGTAAEKSVLAYTTKIMNLRNEHQALWNGSSSVISTGSSDLYVAKKTAGGETIYVAINNGSSSGSFSASGTDLISGQTYNGTVTVPALSAVYLLAK